MENYKFDRKVLAKELNLPQFFQVQETALHALGINMTSHAFYYGRFWKSFLTVPPVICLIFAMTRFAFEHFDDVALLAETFSPVFQFVLITWKIIIILYNRKGLVNLIQRIEQMSLNLKDDEREVLIAENRKDTRLSRVYYLSVVATGFTSMTAPLLKSVLVYMKTGNWQYNTIFKGNFLMDYNVLPYYIIVYIWCSLSVYFGVSGAMLAESLYSWYIHNIAAQFRILQSKLSHLLAQPRVEDITDWLKSHEERIQLAMELNAVYAPILLIQFTLNSAQICVIAFQINGGVSLAELPFHMAFLSAVVVQPTIYCYGGEHVQGESDAIAFAIYDCCNWLNWSVRTLKTMQMAIIRAQKSCKLSGIFFEVNFRLYLWVVRTAASYIMMLYSLK